MTLDHIVNLIREYFHPNHNNEELAIPKVICLDWFQQEINAFYGDLKDEIDICLKACFQAHEYFNETWYKKTQSWMKKKQPWPQDICFEFQTEDFHFQWTYADDYIYLKQFDWRSRYLLAKSHGSSPLGPFIWDFGRADALCSKVRFLVEEMQPVFNSIYFQSYGNSIEEYKFYELCLKKLYRRLVYQIK